MIALAQPFSPAAVGFKPGAPPAKIHDSLTRTSPNAAGENFRGSTGHRPVPPGCQPGETVRVTWTPHPLIDREPDFCVMSDEEFRTLVETCGEETALAYHRRREQRIADSIRDPYAHEFPLPHWAELEANILNSLVTFVPGGNNPGKSRWAASYAVRVLTRKISWPNMPPGKVKALMIAQDDDASKMFQQDKIYQQLPAKWRGLNESAKKPPSFGKYINYSEKNGFTERTLVLPKPLQGQLWFKTVAQYIREPQSFEGPDYDLVIIDEGCPLPLFKTLLGRVAKRGGKIVYILTCVHGYDQTLGAALEGATLVKTLPMQWQWLGSAGVSPAVLGVSPRTSGFANPAIQYPELHLGEDQTDLLKRLGCPAGHMPYLMQPLNPHWRVVFMWNIWNPFQPPGQWRPEMKIKSKNEIKNIDSSPNQNPNLNLNPTPNLFWQAPQLPAQMDSCVGDPRWKVLVKMFGWIERLGQLALGNFNPETHVVRGDRQAALDTMIRAGKATVYMGDDPETQRSHAILWLAVFQPSPAYPQGLKYLFDESPRMREGEWVNANGERGEGQSVYRATGANWYKKYLRDREREWNICDELTGSAGVPPAVRGVSPRSFGNAASETLAAAAGPVALPCIVQRRGDPRGFATEESTATGTRSLFELYLEDHTAEHSDCAPMIFTPAKIRRASMLDLDIIIGLLKYDEDRAAREGGPSAENCPQLLVSARCENFIRCALNYTLTELGKADEDNPYRDFIDALRYVVSGDTPYIAPLKPGELQSGGAW